MVGSNRFNSFNSAPEPLKSQVYKVFCRDASRSPVLDIKPCTLNFDNISILTIFLILFVHNFDASWYVVVAPSSHHENTSQKRSFSFTKPTSSLERRMGPPGAKVNNECIGDVVVSEACHSKPVFLALRRA